MESTGLITSIDGLGRIVIPKSVRDVYNLHTREKFEVICRGGDIILHKIGTQCICCGAGEISAELNKKTFCKKCIEEIKRINFENEG
jgi:transcriptional pleiotropic regulator of transition state genes